MSTEARPQSASRSNAAAALAARIKVVDGVAHYEPDFTPRVKHPVFDMRLHLVTEAAFRVFQNTYDPAQKALYHLYCTLPITMRTQDKMIKEVHAVVEGRFEELENDVAAELQRLAHLAKTDGAESAARYFNEEPLQVVVLTPGMARFLGLIRNMDLIVKTVDALWFAMRMKETERNQKMMEWRNRITRFHRELNNLHMRLLSAGQKKGVSAEALRDEAGASAALDDDGDDTVSATKAKAPAKPRAKKHASQKPSPVVLVTPDTESVAETAAA